MGELLICLLGAVLAGGKQVSMLVWLRKIENKD